MSNGFLTMEEAAAELKLNVVQLKELVSKGKLRELRDQGVQKFKREDIEALKKQAEQDVTVMFDENKTDTEDDSSHLNLGAVTEGESDSREVTEFSMEVVEDKGDTSRIDLADVDAEPGADESDQTSVLPVSDESSETDAGDEEPVFDFAEDDIGLSLDEEPSGSVLVSDEEGSSSADILEVAEELEDESSSDAVVPVRDDSELESATISDSDVVTDILDSDLEESDDDLDTIDLDGVEKAAVGTSSEAGDELMNVIEDETPGSSADTAPLEAPMEAEGEAETVSLEEAEAVTADVGEELLGEEEMAAVEAAAGEEEDVVMDAQTGFYESTDGGEEGYGEYPVPAAMVDYLPWTAGNVLLIVALVLALLGGFVMACEMTGATENWVVTQVHDLMKPVDDWLASL